MLGCFVLHFTMKFYLVVWKFVIQNVTSMKCSFTEPRLLRGLSGKMPGHFSLHFATKVFLAVWKFVVKNVTFTGILSPWEAR